MSREIPQTNRVVLIKTLAFQTRGLVLDRGRRSGLVTVTSPPTQVGKKVIKPMQHITEAKRLGSMDFRLAPGCHHLPSSPFPSL